MVDACNCRHPCALVGMSGEKVEQRSYRFYFGFGDSGRRTGHHGGSGTREAEEDPPYVLQDPIVCFLAPSSQKLDSLVRRN